MKLSLKASPEVIILLPLAIMGDVSGFILLCFGLDDFGLIDAVLDPIFVIWIMIKKKDPTVFKKIIFRLLGYGTLEALPYVGDLFPGYTLLVVQTIMDVQGTEKKTIEITEPEPGMETKA